MLLITPTPTPTPEQYHCISTESLGTGASRADEACDGCRINCNTNRIRIRNRYEADTEEGTSREAAVKIASSTRQVSHMHVHQSSLDSFGTLSERHRKKEGSFIMRLLQTQ